VVDAVAATVLAGTVVFLVGVGGGTGIRIGRASAMPSWHVEHST